MRTCGREICGPVNIDPSNSFNILLGIPAVKALGIELKIKKEYELRPTYGPLRYAECNTADQSEVKQITALECAVVYQEQVLPPSEEEVWKTVMADTPISKVQLQSPYSSSAPCLRKTKQVKFAVPNEPEKWVPKVYTQSRKITIAAEKSTKLWLQVRNGRKQTDALMVLNKTLAKHGLNIIESVVRMKPR